MKASEYLSRPIEVGGMMTTRGALIQQMRKGGVSWRHVDAFIMGLDQRQEIAERVTNASDTAQKA